ncbi:MAG: glycoside hydrolase family 43 protein [Lachnospiraceae bacterium]|nr:glycoside hydrolase family 43 protein [Lachnospiraceae bacterium]
MRSYRNPILPGFHPDPSICRVGDAFYLVTSSFEFFPGIPVYRSRNLTDWRCISHVITRDSQISYLGVPHSGGLYAPTIRYYDGMFYVACTNVSGGGNFIVYAEDPAGQWSDPVYVPSRGIDPSLLFADGTCYFLTTEDDQGNPGICMCEIDPMTGEKLSPGRVLTRGAGGRNAEGPHLYKISGKYYLMLAEGGTEYGHRETLFRSDAPYGPYEPCPYNPILSHAELWEAPIACTGHADLVDDTGGRLWLVCLGVRTLPGVFLHNLGRETFLAPVRWEDGWPFVGRSGRIDLKMEANLPGGSEPDEASRDEGFVADLERETEGFFDDPVLSGEDRELKEMREMGLDGIIAGRSFSFIRNPELPCYEFDTDNESFRLLGGAIGLDDWEETRLSPTFVGVRQEEFYASMEVGVRLLSAENDEPFAGGAGLTAYYSNEHHMDILITKEEGMFFVLSRLRAFNIVQERRAQIPDSRVWLRITADPENYHLYYSVDGRDYLLLDEGATAALCTEITRRMTFTGTFLGFFAEDCEALFVKPRLVFLRDMQ